MKKTVIELGTNSIKYVTAELDPFHFLREGKLTTRLGECLYSTGSFSNISINATLDGIKFFLEENADVEEVEIIGTFGLRTAKNSSYLIKKIKEKFGLNVEIISGNEEAYYSLLSSDILDNSKDKLVFDIGGGSTEIISRKDNTIKSKSYDLGAVTLTEKFSLDSPTDENQLNLCKGYCEKKLIQINYTDCEKSFGVGGTFTTLAMMQKKIKTYDEREINNFPITKSFITDALHYISRLPLKDRTQIRGLSSDRADIIVGGMVIVETLMNIYNLNEINVCCYGVRHGRLFNVKK